MGPKMGYYKPIDKTTIMTDQTYNGWTNYETWNVALWIQNNRDWSDLATECHGYLNWLRNICDCETPDGVNLFGKELDVAALSGMILEM